MTLCPHCEATLETPLVCTSCMALFDADDPSPFAALGLEPRWDVDPAERQKNLLRFTRLLHPDFFATAEPAERERAERGSAQLNRAHEILASDQARADWLIESLGGPSEEDERQMPQAFLLEVLEWNEALEEAAQSAQDSAERRALPTLAEHLRAERAELFEAIGRGLRPLPEAGSAALDELRRDLNAVRYLDRALNQLEALRLESAAH